MQEQKSLIGTTRSLIYLKLYSLKQPIVGKIN